MIIAGASNVDHAIQNINNQELDKVIRDYFFMKKPILGICAGMQIIFNKSEESNMTSTLDILNGEFKKIPNKSENVEIRKVPNIGLFHIVEKKIYLLNKNNKEYTFKVPSGNYYFQHSYYLSSSLNNIIKININYNNIKIPALVAKDNFVGLQFHPELSGKSGMKLISNYLLKT